MKMMLLTIFLCLSAGCKDLEKHKAYNHKLQSGLPLLVATAPDGTKLWKVIDTAEGKLLYFSSKQSQWEITRPVGKMLETEVITVPSAQ
jgi:hypothetical protein